MAGRTAGQRKKNHRVLPRLYRERGGRCERCREPVGVVRELVPLGWVYYAPAGCVVAPDGSILPAATVEHARRLCDGGDYAASNLLLYCEPCNRATNPGHA